MCITYAAVYSCVAHAPRVALSHTRLAYTYIHAFRYVSRAAKYFSGLKVGVRVLTRLCMHQCTARVHANTRSHPLQRCSLTTLPISLHDALPCTHTAQQPIASLQQGGSIDLVELPRLRLCFSTRHAQSPTAAAAGGAQPPVSHLYSHEVWRPMQGTHLPHACIDCASLQSRGVSLSGSCFAVALAPLSMME
jgi:hypothetical protein